MLNISTRSIPPKGLDTSGKGHDGIGGNEGIYFDRGMYPDLQWTTDTEQLIMDGRVASPGFYTTYETAILHATNFWEPSLMRPGGGKRNWLRHEDWEKANDEAKKFQ